MKKTLLFCFLICVFDFCFSQEVLQIDPRLKVQYIEEICHDASKGKHQKELLFQFKNISNSILEFEYSFRIDYGTYCVGCASQEHIKVHTKTLSPNQVINGECFDKNSGLSAVVQVLAPGAKSELKSIALDNVKIVEK